MDVTVLTHTVRQVATIMLTCVLYVFATVAMLSFTSAHPMVTVLLPI